MQMTKLHFFILILALLSAKACDLTYNVGCMNKTHAICCPEKCTWTCQLTNPSDARCRAGDNGILQCIEADITGGKLEGPENFCLKQIFKKDDTCLIKRVSNSNYYSANCKNSTEPICCEEACTWKPTEKFYIKKTATCKKEENTVYCKEDGIKICEAQNCGFDKEFGKDETCNITAVWENVENEGNSQPTQTPTKDNFPPNKATDSAMHLKVTLPVVLLVAVVLGVIFYRSCCRPQG